ncbi:hypothetical protein EI033_23895 [Escherichia coli]|nr:hypothetical protein [Escherichia coli]
MPFSVALSSQRQCSKSSPVLFRFLDRSLATLGHLSAASGRIFLRDKYVDGKRNEKPEQER